jgi:oxalate decarboxylase/phosphoglucose isomerase-like protein (cupin superfamily)
MQPDGNMFTGDVEEGDLWIFPAGHPHSIQGLGPDGTEFLLVFNQGGFSEDGTMLLSEWTAHTPPEVLAKNAGAWMLACLPKPRSLRSTSSPARNQPLSLRTRQRSAESRLLLVVSTPSA